MTVVGTPMPVMPQAPMRPRATSCSNAGRTASANRRWGVPGIWSALASDDSIFSVKRRGQPYRADIRARLSSRLCSNRGRTSLAARCRRHTWSRCVRLVAGVPPKAFVEYHLGFATTHSWVPHRKGAYPLLEALRTVAIASARVEVTPDLPNAATAERESTPRCYRVAQRFCYCTGSSLSSIEDEREA